MALKKRDPQTLPTTHKFRHLKGWNDVDFKMLHACFDFLCDYVEKEKGQEMLDHQYEHMIKLSKSDRVMMYNSKKEFEAILRVRRNDARTCRELYNWWTTDYVPKWKAGTWDGLYSDEQGDIEQKMLMKLIRIRRLLWT